MQSIYIEAGKRIYSLRMRRGYTRKYLAESASISPKFLYEIENGKKGFSASVLCRISDALEVDCDYIMTGKEKDASGYDKRLREAIELFDKSKTEQLSAILRQISQLL